MMATLDRVFELESLMRVGFLYMAGMLAFVTFARSSSPFSDEIAAGMGADFYHALSDNLRFLLNHVFAGFFALGGILGVCMAILWGG